MMFTCTGLYMLHNRLIALLNTREESTDELLSTVADTVESPELTPTKSNNTIEPIQQIPSAIRDFSSQYGSNRSDTYVVSNICAGPQIFPHYGDSTHSLVFRTYGPWWINLPSYQESARNFTRWENRFTSRDFIDIEFQDFVGECTSLNVYETYNPGTLEVVYVGKEDENGAGTNTWHRVWTFPEPFIVILKNNEEFYIENGLQTMKDMFPNLIGPDASGNLSLNNHELKQISKIYTHHTFPPAARLPRIVKIPLKNKFSFPTRLVRLEFDHSTVNYYTEIDTVVLCGSPFCEDSQKCLLPPVTEIVEHEEEQIEINSQIGLNQLPFDVLFTICTYLDLRSLVRLSSTCRYLHEQCLHPLQFQSLNLQPYWNGISNDAIENFFIHHCTQTRCLSLAWSKTIQLYSFTELLHRCSTHLIQLDLACCQYLTGTFIKILVNNCPKIEILNLENCVSLSCVDFIHLKYLEHLRSLNVYRTRIDFRTLLPLIANNREHLENINLGGCQKLIDTVGIVKLLFARCSRLRSLDLWRAHSLTQNGFLSIAGLRSDIDEEKRRMLNFSKDEQEELATLYASVDMPMEIHSIRHLECLREIDLGWTDPPPGFVRSFVIQAGKNLIKLFLTACRRVSNEDIIAVSENCFQLRQLDVLGSSIIIETSIESVLKRCSHLEFLDLSFCDKISDSTIERWICQYKNCFKRSYSPATTDDVYTEFA